MDTEALRRALAEERAKPCPNANRVESLRNQIGELVESFNGNGISGPNALEAGSEMRKMPLPVRRDSSAG
jgi:hypothetical protein